MSKLDDLKTKIDEVADKLNAEGICKAEAKAMQRAMKDIQHALNEYNTAHNSRALSGLSAAGATVALAGCPLIETGFGAAVCAVGGGMVAVGAFLNWWNEGDAEDLAAEDFNDAMDDLERAIDDVCGCTVKAHSHPNG